MRFDVVIVGGGLVGASLALALRGLELDVLVVEAHLPGSSLQPSFDDRTTALGNGTRRIFEALGVWDAMRAEAAAIRTIHVSERGGFGFARLVAREQDIDAFGYVVANRVIGRALWEALRRPGAQARLELRVPATVRALEYIADGVALDIDAGAGAGSGAERVTASLVVAADGAQSLVREWAGIGAHVEDYGQTALIANVRAGEPNDGTAWERFTPTGPLALLPLHDGSYTVVWTLAPQRAAEVVQLDDTGFLAGLQDAFGWRAGRFERVGRRAAYPLTLTRADTTVAERAVLIGNASQALHPVAGQGFNLGLRDAATLAEVLADTLAAADDARGARPDLGAAAVLAAFAAARVADRRGVTGFTDGLIRLFRDARPGIGIARNLGLLLFDLTPPAKRALSRLSSGFTGRSSRLARGLRLP